MSTSEELGPKEWLRCNNCYILMLESKVPFFLSFCSHIFCTKCVKIAKKKCPQCQTKNLRIMPLVEPLSPEVKHCFEPIENISEKFLQAINFQNQQMDINKKRFSTVEKKYSYIKGEYQRINNAFKTSKNRMQEMESELKLLRKKISDLEESPRNMRYTQNPQSFMESAHSHSNRSSSHSGSDNQPLPKRRSFHSSLLTPIKLEQLNLNSEFRSPLTTRVPRSVGGSSKNSCNSLRTPFTIASSCLDR
ncbi:zip homologous protein 1-like [Leptopilina heterotoma]|uniref:zip homologous protein 1-like n=1 Tax=Leptopilina heterotoma TaxID=63436 RepID=UPI001CA8A70A|nr:zip homologous protein 1-like [Leptopilina heterotoma]